MDNSHDNFMNTREEKIILSIGLDEYRRREVEDEYLDRSGSDNPYHDYDLYRKIEAAHRTEIVLRGMTWHEAQVFAEPIRIAHPDQNITLYNPDYSSFIGNTTWNDQMKMFFGYPVFTPYGEKLKAEANLHAEINGIAMAWE